MYTEEINKKTAKGFSWLTLGVSMQWAVDIFTRIVLVRLLLPVDFGVFATACIFINLFRVLKEAGISTAIIQKKDVDDESLSSAFFFNILISFILLVIVFFFIPLAASYFKNNSLTPIIRTLSLVILIESFIYVHSTLFAKKLNFRDTIIPSWAGVITYSVLGITLAYLNFGLWSLVWSSLARSIITSILFWRVNPWRPRFSFNYLKFKALLDFGIKVSAIRMLRYARHNIDYLVIAKFLGPVFLGYYFVAYTMSHYCNRQLSPLLSRIFFPAFSQLNDGQKMQKYYFEAVKYSAVIGIPAYLIIFVLGREIVLFFYGPNWLPAAIPFKILSLCACLKFLEVSVFSPLLIAKGNIYKFFKINIFMLLINAIAVFLGVSHGIIGVAFSLLFAGMLNFAIIMVLTLPILNCKWHEYAKKLFPVILSGIIMLMFLFLLRMLPYRGRTFVSLEAVLALTIYVILLKLWKIDLFEKIRFVHRLIIS